MRTPPPLKATGPGRWRKRETTKTILIACVVVFVQAFFNMTWRLYEAENSAACGNNQVEASLSNFMATSIRKTSHNATIFLNLTQTNFGGVQARAFETWGNRPLPCAQAEKHWMLSKIQRSPAREGFLMAKEMKTGSSSAAGINIRISRNVARRFFPQYKPRICKHRNDHTYADKLEYKFRNRSKSFLWTVIREPTKRVISQFFHFEVSRKKIEPTDEKFQGYISKEVWLEHYYLRSLSVEKQWIHQAGYDPVAVANKILHDEYDFIGITERMDESAVALQLLLGLKTSDILFLNSKNSGGFDDGASPLGCVYIVPSFVSPGMKEYFASHAWQNLIFADALLHEAANKSLDLTINRLGPERFQAALIEFRHAQQVARDTCLPKVRLPCTNGGKQIKNFQCVFGDSACGTLCLDELAPQFNRTFKSI
jgi:hypothetical protein